MSVAFRSAKVALIRGAKGDNGIVIYRTVLSSFLRHSDLRGRSSAERRIKLDRSA